MFFIFQNYANMNNQQITAGGIAKDTKIGTAIVNSNNEIYLLC